MVKGNKGHAHLDQWKCQKCSEIDLTFIPTVKSTRVSDVPDVPLPDELVPDVLDVSFPDVAVPDVSTDVPAEVIEISELLLRHIFCRIAH